MNENPTKLILLGDGHDKGDRKQNKTLPYTQTAVSALRKVSIVT